VRKLAVLVTTMAIAAVACSGSGEPPPNLALPPDDGRDVELALASGDAALERFDECGDLLDYVHEEALELVGPYGLEGFGGFAVGGPAMALEDSAESGAGGDAAAPAAAPSTTQASRNAAGGEAGGTFSGTNVQVQGVDEPDIVKTDGEIMLASAQGRIHVFDVSGDEPRKVAELDFREKGFDHQLMLDGDRLLVLTRGSVPVAIQDGRVAGDDVVGIGVPAQESTVVTVVDLADPANPQTVSTLTLDGGYLSARLVGGVVRIVTRTTPMALPFVGPMEGTPAAAAKAAEVNRGLVEESKVEDWLPSYELESDGSVSSGQLVACDQVHHPVEFAGPGTLTVVTVDPDDPKPGNAVSVLAGGDTVYASSQALYVATADWSQMRILNEGGGQPPPEEVELSTQIHKFDISDAATTRYIGSGSVEGTLLNQFSMDELDGNLRVATTSFPTWFGGGPEGEGPTSESFVTVLTQREDKLEPIGRVGGLGKGEQIYSVRFIGELGYVVTFRQTDPLYVIDLSDPTAPAVRGELKILGYSAYLHPIGDGLLLGVGQDATEEGRVQGTQLAVFDVSDPANPRRVHQLRLDNANSEAEYDHHAFLYWPATGLTVLPLQTYGRGACPECDVIGPEGFWAGAVAFDVDPDSGIDEVGRISHMRNAEDYMGQIRRSVVVGPTLYTLSEAGLMASDLDTLGERAFVGFPPFEEVPQGGSVPSEPVPEG
jgi:uncharacterized secreted protein with C-terminal beta-propeller domain